MQDEMFLDFSKNVHDLYTILLYTVIMVRRTRKAPPDHVPPFRAAYCICRACLIEKLLIMLSTLSILPFYEGTPRSVSSSGVFLCPLSVKRIPLQGTKADLSSPAARREDTGKGIEQTGRIWDCCQWCTICLCSDLSGKVEKLLEILLGFCYNENNNRYIGSRAIFSLMTCVK